VSAPGIIATNLKLICGNGIIATVDIQVIGWKIRLRGCRWRRGDAGGEERITTGPCDSIEFLDPAIEQRFQKAALLAVRGLAQQIVAPAP
jgi:hypothetical protein